MGTSIGGCIYNVGTKLVPVFFLLVLLPSCGLGGGVLLLLLHHALSWFSTHCCRSDHVHRVTVLMSATTPSLCLIPEVGDHRRCVPEPFPKRLILWVKQQTLWDGRQVKSSQLLQVRN